jgi:HAD superfamily hydrolase (TIGR01509 family)
MRGASSFVVLSRRAGQEETMPLRAVLFDLWETLINDVPERSQPRRQWRKQRVLEVLEAHACAIEGDAVLAALDACTTALTRMHDTGRDTDSAGRAMLFVDELEARSGERAPAPALAELEEVITCMPLDMAPRLAADAVETVSVLKQRGLGLALVCNAGFTTAPHLRVMLAHYGLLPQFDVMVFSDELQVAKPNPLIFRHALEGIGLDAADCAFIGDNPHTDISGAMAAGMFAVQIGAKVREGITPHARVDSLTELLACSTPPCRLWVDSSPDHLTLAIA